MMIGKNILVIDDSEAVLVAFERCLMGSGHNVHLTESGERGLEKWQAIKPDLIFLDLKLNAMTGSDVLSSVRATDKRTPVYVMSESKPEFSHRLEHLKRSGAEFEVIHKPLSAREIQRVVAANVGWLSEHDGNERLPGGRQHESGRTPSVSQKGTSNS